MRFFTVSVWIGSVCDFSNWIGSVLNAPGNTYLKNQFCYNESNPISRNKKCIILMRMLISTPMILIKLKQVSFYKNYYFIKIKNLHFFKAKFQSSDTS